jgi:hypothetical protein
MTADPVTQSKKDVALALLEGGADRLMLLGLDPRAVTVKVPSRFKDQPMLTLQVGRNMRTVRDLRIDDDGISGTLSFDKRPFFCVLPWTAIFALGGEDVGPFVWGEDIPKDLSPGFVGFGKRPAERGQA